MKILHTLTTSMALFGMFSCGGGGSSTSEAQPPNTGGGSGGSQQAPFSLSSTAFSDGGMIPQKHTCDGQDVSPPFTWNNPPQGTLSFVIVVDDPDAQQVAGKVWTHWVIYDIPATRNSLQEGFPKQASVDGIKQGPTDFGQDKIGYYGPCPPQGRRHTYRFTVYAISKESLGLPAGATLSQVRSAMQGNVLAEATIRGVYGR